MSLIYTCRHRCAGALGGKGGSGSWELEREGREVAGP